MNQTINTHQIETFRNDSQCLTIPNSKQPSSESNPDGNKTQGDIDPINENYLDQAKVLIQMLKQNPKSLIQSNQVKVYVDHHY